MKIAIVNNMVPFIYGGAEFLADSLAEKLVEYGHKAQVIRLPFAWSSAAQIAESMLAVKLTRIINTDKVIALKFPAYYIEHPNKTLWLLHQFRQAYDLQNTEYDFFAQDHEYQKLKAAIYKTDNECFTKLSGKIYTNSKVVSERLMKYNNIPSKVLYPPLMESEIYYNKECGDYIFYPSRVNHSKRQHLAVEAMRYVKSGVKLVLAGKGDSKEDENSIFELIERYDVKDKVTYLDRFISQQEKADLFANCLGGIYIPYDEDSYGYVTLESIHSEKPIISCNDAGGTYVVVKDSETGYMTESTPKALAAAMDKLYQNKQKAIEMGKNGLQLLKELGITWDNVIRSLLK